jgi:hypothetical protein
LCRAPPAAQTNPAIFNRFASSVTATAHTRKHRQLAVNLVIDVTEVNALPSRYTSKPALMHLHSQCHPSAPAVKSQFRSVLCNNKRLRRGATKRRAELGGQGAKPTDQVASPVDSGERYRLPRRTRRGDRSRTGSDRKCGVHEYRGNHHLNDAADAATDCRCLPNHEGNPTQGLLTPTGPVRRPGTYERPLGRDLPGPLTDAGSVLLKGAVRFGDFS